MAPTFYIMTLLDHQRFSWNATTPTPQHTQTLQLFFLKCLGTQPLSQSTYNTLRAYSFLSSVSIKENQEFLEQLFLANCRKKCRVIRREQNRKSLQSEGDCKEVAPKNEVLMGVQGMEQANKRIPVTDEIWKTLSSLKRPGQTYDSLLAEMIEIKQERDFLAQIEEIEKTGQFISLSEAAEELGITDMK